MLQIAFNAAKEAGRASDRRDKCKISVVMTMVRSGIVKGACREYHTHA